MIMLRDLEELDHNKISDQKVEELGREIRNVVRNLKLGKSLGQNGFIADFFICFL